MTQYNRLRDDLGKGFQTLRRAKAHVVLANGTVIAVIDQIPAKFTIRRVLMGSAVATDITGNAEVLALAQGSDLDTAAGAGNRVITPVAAFADKKLNAQTLTALGAGEFAAETVLVLSVTHNAAVVGGDVDCVVEYDVVGTTYGGYDDGGSSLGTYD